MQETNPTNLPYENANLGSAPQPTQQPMQQPVQHPPYPETDNDFWTKALIFFNPLASIIVYLLKRDTEPALAKRALGTGWFAVKFWTIVALVLMAFYLMIIPFSIFASLASVGGSGW